MLKKEFTLDQASLVKTTKYLLDDPNIKTENIPWVCEEKEKFLTKFEDIHEKTDNDNGRILLDHYRLKTITLEEIKNFKIEEIKVLYNEHLYIKLIDGTDDETNIVQTLNEKIQ